MAVEDRSLSEFPRALQVAEQALVMISNPDGLGGYDTNGAVLTEVGKALLNVQYTQQLGNVSVFDAIKNCRVLSGTTTPLANEGANGQLYVKYQTVSDVDTVIGMYFKKNGAWLEISLGGGGGSSYVELTQAEYDAMEQAGTLDPTVMYFITDGQSGGGATELADLDDVNLTNPTDGQLLRYNGTSGKWENAGIINDTTASASSVYSSNKVNRELALKQNSTDNSLTTTNKQIVPAINELKSGKQDALNKGSIINVDLNTLKSNGVYFVNGSGTALNAPTNTYYGILEVVAASVILQRSTNLGPEGTGVTQYERIFINNAWTSWKKITRNIT